MTVFQRFLTALQFFTRLPLPQFLQPPFDEDAFAPSLMWAPLVGLLIGGLTCLPVYLLNPWLTPSLRAALILVLYVLISGGLHLDGLGDTFDGLGSGRSRERMLEIMRDSRIGSFALLAVVSYLLLSWSCLQSLPEAQLWPLLLLWPVLGRLGLLLSAATSVYARPESGLGRALIDYCSPIRLLPWLLAVILPVCALGSWPWLGLVLAALAAAWLSSRLIAHSLGGATGDTLGAVAELTQVSVLIIAVIIRNLL